MDVRTYIPRLWATGLAVLLAAGTVAYGQRWDKKTILTVHERIEVPGTMLEPGNYVLRLVDSDANRHIVRLLNEREDKVISTVIAIPNYRLKVTGDTQFAWYERPMGEPRALRAWFYPGDNFGQEFVYPKRRAMALAEAVQEPVPFVEDIEEPVMKAEVKPEAPPAPKLKQAEVRPTPPPVRKPAPEPVQIAQARPPEPAPAPEPARLPRTAGLGMLFGLLGLAALGTAAGLGLVVKPKR
jgi:hypothetical protein